MGLLNDFASKGLNLVGAKTSAGVASPTAYGEDFPDGLIITEIINGKTRDREKIQLVGRFSPHQPFEFGGEQRIVREEYPGSSEPTIHILGPKESVVTIKGEMKTNKFRGNEDLRDAAHEYQMLIDAMRIRGNLVRIQLGEWLRYGFIQKSNFKLFTLQHIAYDISFEIVGFNPPKGWRVVIGSDLDVVKPNKEITNAAALALKNASNIPKSMPLSAADTINNAISDIASAIKKVTDFTDGIIGDADKIVASANRAIGLIKNARAVISRSKRQIGEISKAAGGLAGSAAIESKKAIDTINNNDHLAKTIGGYSDIASLLAKMQMKFKAYSKNVPFRRHLVRQGDTLNSLSMKYYNTADNWKLIYDHNKLTDTVLTIGSVLEIPKG